MVAVELKDAYSQLKELELNNKTIVVTCNCSVKYKGRAESYLSDGDRLIIIKSDKSVLVHQPVGSTPINYMKDGCTWRVLYEDGILTMLVNHLAFKESLEIVLNKVMDISSHTLEDGKKLQLYGSEKDMSEMIYNNPTLIDKNFRPVSMEEQTQYGYIDVLGTDKDNNLVVVECKRYAADLKAVSQLRRYVEKIKKSRGVDKVSGIIAAPRISPNAEKMLVDWGFAFKKVRPPNYLEEYDKSQSSLGDF